jgi:hypothetical protein
MNATGDEEEEDHLQVGAIVGETAPGGGMSQRVMYKLEKIMGLGKFGEVWMALEVTSGRQVTKFHSQACFPPKSCHAGHKHTRALFSFIMTPSIAQVAIKFQPLDLGKVIAARLGIDKPIENTPDLWSERGGKHLLPWFSKEADLETNASAHTQLWH